MKRIEFPVSVEQALGMRQRKRVTYQSASFVKVGRSAHLIGVKNHPDIRKGDYVVTSPVTLYEPGSGLIITLNTVYSPEKQS